jgi:hypothetical protein
MLLTTDQSTLPATIGIILAIIVLADYTLAQEELWLKTLYL